jgi:hypothetical protein
MNQNEKYHNAIAAPKTAGDWINGILSPHTFLTNKKEETVTITPEELLASSKIKKEKNAKVKKKIIITVSIVSVIGIGIGLYYALKK